MAEHAGGGGSRRHGRAEERGGDGGCAPRRGVARVARHVLRRGRRRGGQWLLRHAERSERGLAGGAGGRLRRVPQGISGLARARPSERGRAGQAAAPHARSGHGLQGRPAVHAVRHAGRRRATAGDAAGLPQHHRVRHVAAAGGRGPARRDPELPRFVLAASGLSRAGSIASAGFPPRPGRRSGISVTSSRSVPTGTGGRGRCARLWSAPMAR